MGQPGAVGPRGLKGKQGSSGTPGEKGVKGQIGPKVSRYFTDVLFNLLIITACFVTRMLLIF